MAGYVHARVVARDEPVVWVPAREQGSSRRATDRGVGEEVLQRRAELAHHREGVPHAVLDALRDQLLVVRDEKNKVGPRGWEMVIVSPVFGYVALVITGSSPYPLAACKR